MAQGRFPIRRRSAVAAAFVVVFCGAVSTTVAADGDALATASEETGVVDGAIVAVDAPPVPVQVAVGSPPVPVQVAVGLPPVPVQVAVGRPPVAPLQHAQVQTPGRDPGYGDYELTETITDAFAMLRAGLAFFDELL